MRSDATREVDGPGRRLPWSIAALLLGSGFCALVYQMAWQRELRLVFGASTAASAAVLAIFIGGLGAGGLALGRRVDRHPAPLRLYAQLEMAIAACAAITPALVWAVRQLYIGVGGTTALGAGGGTLLRLALAALVLLPPTLLMGGTLPAAGRAAEHDDDRGRGRLALLYGANTLGAVIGCALATFLLLEFFGTRGTVWFACLLNLLVALTARVVARNLPDGTPTRAGRPATTAAVPGGFAYGASGVVGFAFFLMELVWYRMLGPILGGTIFAFGLILTVALLGIGLGGVAYSVWRGSRPATVRGFAISCLLEAALIALPFALGDRLAVSVLLLKPLTVLGFAGHLARWFTICAVVILPPAFVSGVQFPWLIALLGEGRRDLGRQLGLAYAWNTAGAIAGALAGGFGLLPLLSAPGCWRLVAGLLALLGVGAAAAAVPRERGRIALAAPAVLLAAVVAFVRAPGPSAFWRHSPVGHVRATLPTSANLLHDWIDTQRRVTTWETDGVESSVALNAQDGLAFVVNGRIDGNAVGDASTQVMSGLVGALLHPQPRRALVIGLGTGSTAGWLGAIPAMERVDVIELEPAILEVARRCAVVNQNVLANPKVHVQTGDAREVVLTMAGRYDLVFSEPSNPFRAGIASLFSRDYYRGVAQRLAPGGLFIQWVQGYEVDSQTIGAIYATLGSVFPWVESWQTNATDLLLVASLGAIPHDADALRARLAEEPYATALRVAWRGEGVESFLAHYAGGPALARAIATEYRDLVSTDDQNFIEFGFAKTTSGSTLGFRITQLRELARRHDDQQPTTVGDAVDWARAREEAMLELMGEVPVDAGVDAAAAARITARRRYLGGDLAGALAAWRAQDAGPAGPVDRLLLAEALADAGDEQALRWIDALRSTQATEAEAVTARLRLRQGRHEDAARALGAAFVRFRSDPWAYWPAMRSAMDTAHILAGRDPALAERVFEALAQPFAAFAMEDHRKKVLATVARELAPEVACMRTLDEYGRFVPWQYDFLVWRKQCYRAMHHPGFDGAVADLTDFMMHEPLPLLTGTGTRVAQTPRSNF